MLKADLIDPLNISIPTLCDIEKNIDIEKNHRIFHILNRNIKKENRFSFVEIRNAFLSPNKKEKSKRDKYIYEKIFKEIDIDDLESFCAIFCISKRNIKKIYVQIPERHLSGVAKIWDKHFQVKPIKNRTTVYATPSLALQIILKKRGICV